MKRAKRAKRPGARLQEGWRIPPLPSLSERLRLPYHGFPLQTLFLGFLDPLPRDLRILDVGCGAGFLMQTLACLGNHVRGVDASGPLVRWLREDYGMDVRHCEVGRCVPRHAPRAESETPRVGDEAPRTGDEAMAAMGDAIFCLDVLEHVAHRSAFLDELFASIGPDAFLFLTVANYQGHGGGGFVVWDELVPHLEGADYDLLRLRFPLWFELYQRVKLKLRRSAGVVEGDRFDENPGFRHIRKSPAAGLSCLWTSMLLMGFRLFGLRSEPVSAIEGPGSYLLLCRHVEPCSTDLSHPS